MDALIVPVGTTLEHAETLPSDGAGTDGGQPFFEDPFIVLGHLLALYEPWI